MACKTWRTWTVKELRLLEELRHEGLSAYAIAERLGRTVASVKNRLAEEGIRKPRRDLVWLRILSHPHTIAGVAQKRGVTTWAVKRAKNRLRRAGFDIPAALRAKHAV
jgi:transposase